VQSIYYTPGLHRAADSPDADGWGGWRSQMGQTPDKRSNVTEREKSGQVDGQAPAHRESASHAPRAPASRSALHPLLGPRLATLEPALTAEAEALASAAVTGMSIVTIPPVMTSVGAVAADEGLVVIDRVDETELEAAADEVDEAELERTDDDDDEREAEAEDETRLELALADGVGPSPGRKAKPTEAGLWRKTV
jgi:hypothetical protein